MGIPEWEGIAIPEGFGPYRLLYNPISETVIAEWRSIGEQLSPNQIYVRNKDAPKYEPIKDLQPIVSSESAVPSLGRPLLFYLSNRLEKVDQAYKGDWQGLYSFDLQSRKHLKTADKNLTTGDIHPLSHLKGGASSKKNSRAVSSWPSLPLPATSNPPGT